MATTFQDDLLEVSAATLHAMGAIMADASPLSSASGRATMRTGERSAPCTASFRIAAVGAFPRVLGSPDRPLPQKRAILRHGARCCAYYRDFSGLNDRAQIISG
jgi:hypothetical protein